MNKNHKQVQPEKIELYEIRLKGHLDEHWSEWFNDLTVTYDEQDNTMLTGPVVDQSALHGLLKKVRDLGLPVISINPIEVDSEEMT